MSGLIAARELRGFRLRDAHQDVRGWDVLAGDGTRVGTVEQLLVDPKSRRVRYLAIVLGDGARRRAVRRRRVLAPVGLARRLDGRRTITLDVPDAARLAAMPAIRNRPVTRADEDAALAALGVRPPATGDGDRYAGAGFDDRWLFGTAAADTN
ncbi:MAG TPA: PRC-barrel domain-containing protein [Gemmatimonadaceae bacterium]|nr:PRC-barrel domain-containing protein [Gemmatimonadaceae bacterium]